VFEYAILWYAVFDRIPPPRPVIDITAVLAALTQANFLDLDLEFDEHKAPAHEPYGKSTFLL
jgi:hypothetical protein